MKTVLTFTISLIVAISFAQPETEVYVFKLNQVGDSYTINEPQNVTYENPGYDNQPHFLPKGESMYYVSTKNGQTDVAEVEFREFSWSWLSSTDGSEYSPTPLPDNSGFSAIRLEKDGTQLLYKYMNDFSEPTVLVPDLKIGYHCWFDQSTIVAFVLGEPATLRVYDLEIESNLILDKNIGRSLHKIPGKERVSYISKETTPWQIKEIDPISGSSEPIIETVEGAEDMAWTPDGDIIMGKENTLYKYSPERDKKWIKMADLDDFELKGITRIAVSPKGDRIAVVVNQ
ncbi:MAG: hypothetical protein ACFB2Y_21100 [Fulvivirga sp.]